MEYEEVESMTEDDPNYNAETLDELLSMRGKPFSDWKEERKYLRDKWGMQGKELQLDSEESGEHESTPENVKES